MAGRELTIGLRTLGHVRWVKAIVTVNGARFATIGRARLTRPVTLTGLPRGRFVLEITARASNERRVSGRS